MEAHRNDTANVWHGLVDNDAWQASYLSGQELQELAFWMGGQPDALTAVAAADAGGTTVPARRKIRGTSTRQPAARGAANKKT